jgi:carbon-monoxide dehydrogenase medium subunit
MDFLGDIHASEDYRRAMVKVYARRALTKAIERARG